jgi:predicted metalloprotease with PDZ domain
MPRIPAPWCVLGVSLIVAGDAQAQTPLRNAADAVEIRYARTQPVLSYTLRVASASLSAFDVELWVRNAPDTFRVAMVAHPEYDDRYWRYIEALSVEAPGGPATIAREDSALWRVVARGGRAVVHYRLRLPPSQSPRAAWRPFLAPTGGLVGGPHSFLYVLGATLAPAHVTLELPLGWDVATGLEPTADPRTFFAPSVAVLVDCPILVGRLRSWRFSVDGVPHRVVYWPLPDAAPFDTGALVNDIERLVRQAVALFGRAPYREYTFLLQDGAQGALEHHNSVTLGAPSATLASDSTFLLPQIAHEYFHTWNLMRIRPVEYGDVDYRPPPPTRGLWWSEGLTMFYADLLLRRASLPGGAATRVTHLEQAIARYLASPGNARFAPESVSLIANGPRPDALGDYSASVHLQGELLGTMLDLMVRDATAGRRSMDDVMRAMLERFSGERGFTERDIEQTVGDVCRCDPHAFFVTMVRGAHPIAFDRYLGLIGMQLLVSWAPSVGPEGQPAADGRASTRGRRRETAR